MITLSGLLQSSVVPARVFERRDCTARSLTVWLSSLALTACAFMGACKSTSGACARNLLARFDPSDTTIAIGRQFRASVELWGCDGTVRLSDVITWRSENLGVVTVDSVSGLVSAIGLGQVRVTARGQVYPVPGSISVSVRSGTP